jgi:hypothetical protein
VIRRCHCPGSSLWMTEPDPPPHIPHDPARAPNLRSTATHGLLLPDGGAAAAGKEGSSLALRTPLGLLRLVRPPPVSPRLSPFPSGTIRALPAGAGTGAAAAAAYGGRGAPMDVPHLRRRVRVASGAARALQVRPPSPQRNCPYYPLSSPGTASSFEYRNT